MRVWVLEVLLEISTIKTFMSDKIISTKSDMIAEDILKITSVKAHACFYKQR